jgi:hypothetical protein
MAWVYGTGDSGAVCYIDENLAFLRNGFLEGTESSCL